jgi:hypothetical protein
MTAITLNEKIKIRRDAESLKHRLNSFTDAGATCELCRAQVRFVDGRVELDEALTAVCAGATQIILKDAPLVTAVYHA